MYQALSNSIKLINKPYVEASERYFIQINLGLFSNSKNEPFQNNSLFDNDIFVKRFCSLKKGFADSGSVDDVRKAEADNVDVRAMVVQSSSDSEHFDDIEKLEINKRRISSLEASSLGIVYESENNAYRRRLKEWQAASLHNPTLENEALSKRLLNEPISEAIISSNSSRYLKLKPGNSGSASKKLKEAFEGNKFLKFEHFARHTNRCTPSSSNNGTIKDHVDNKNAGEPTSLTPVTSRVTPWRKLLNQWIESRIFSTKSKELECQSSSSLNEFPDSNKSFSNLNLSPSDSSSNSVEPWMLKTALDLEDDQVITDNFGRRHTYLRISLTERCNLRCSYCMPEEGVDLSPPSNLLTVDEILKLAALFVSAGVTKIRLTGGEPTLNPDLINVVRGLDALKHAPVHSGTINPKHVTEPRALVDIGITSNGLVLSKQLAALKAAGLTAINISLDTLRPDRFIQLTRRKGLSRVLDSIRTALDLGYNPVKVNVVLIRGVNEDEILDFVRMTESDPVNVRFIEYMPFDGNIWEMKKMVPFSEVVEVINKYLEGSGSKTSIEEGMAREGKEDQEKKKLKRIVSYSKSEVAANYQIPGHVGTVSFVSSMTDSFCGGCNRLRLLADGSLKVCLFGASEVSLRDALREGASLEELRALIAAALSKKAAAHAGMTTLALKSSENRPMTTIGG
mmetsp:Transcript_12403/g.22187  ORF Transcript_12403/g.22187 Transcript_12403/m.22187 type:complete len:681 (-) Transcript_12403:180-2222(-)